MSVLMERWLEIPVSRRRRTLLIVVGAIFLGVILWRTRTVLAPFMLGLLLAYLLAPLVKVIERGWRWVGARPRLRFFRRAARPLALVLTYLLVIAALVGFSALIVPILSQQGQALWAERERVLDYLTGLGDDLIAQYRLLPPQVQTRVDETLSRFTGQLGVIIQQALSGTAIAISYTITLVLAVLLIPFWTFYMLLDAERLAQSAKHNIPSVIREDVLKIMMLADAAFGSYLRGQLLLGLIIGSVSAIAFTIMGVRFSLFLGMVAGAFELIPNIGPLLGAIPAVLVALTQNPILALWVALYALGIQQVENLFITPRVVGRSVKLHPVVVMVVLVIGSELGGLAGLFLAPVATAALRDLFRYLYYRSGDVPLSPEEALDRVWHEKHFDLKV
ncbi:MAG TPA: AI-2E family transporter [Anaerolineae bacterium]|nr:AI-2E family transporter [Anaerolineae bacterium]